MGRELKRVPLDFRQPLNKPWNGYINPHYKECPGNCDGGYSASYRIIAKHLNGLMWNRAVISDKNGSTITGFLCGRPPRAPFGHDSVDAYTAVKKLGELAGLPNNWHTCQVCDGSGMDPECATAYDAWDRTEPPTGPGYQIWETVSEGSPITPVFSTPEELAHYASTHPWGGDTGGDYSAWLRFINGPGWAPSMVVENGVIKTGANAAFSERAAK